MFQTKSNAFDFDDTSFLVNGRTEDKNILYKKKKGITLFMFKKIISLGDILFLMNARVCVFNVNIEITFCQEDTNN